MSTLCQLLGKEPDNIDIIKEALKDDIDVSTHILSLDTIVDATCSYFNVKKQDIIGKKKLKPIVNARQIAIYLIYDMLGVQFLRMTVGRKNYLFFKLI